MRSQVWASTTFKSRGSSSSRGPFSSISTRSCGGLHSSNRRNEAFERDGTDSVFHPHVLGEACKGARHRHPCRIGAWLVELPGDLIEVEPQLHSQHDGF